MKRIYWRPQKVSRIELGLIAALSAILLVAVERLVVVEEQPWHAEKLAAAQLARRAFDQLRAERERLGLEVDPTTDPTGSGLIGLAMSDVTTNTGHLAAKQTSINPNFAAVIVHYLKRAGVEAGDPVAVGLSGSFPALNVAVYAAIETIGARALPVSSVSASQWGANDPRFMWLDMERLLLERQVFRIRSIAASRGGIEDRALGIGREGRQHLDLVIERNGVPALKPKDYAQSVESRMAAYEAAADGRVIKAYVNVGGGTTSVGTRLGKQMFQPGLNRAPPPGLRGMDSVMSRFSQTGVPVIHLVKIGALAARFGLPLQPTELPRAGEGEVFAKKAPNRWLAAAGVLTIFGLLYGFIRRDFGLRILRGLGRKGDAAPERMV
ncbi:poly-gamma-glutamate system protein [Myxococcota bacterium]|nr:poly-gamma-glutamate system protein [Myxococcota bacterium]